MIGRVVDSIRRAFTLPLLARELTEASARRRTYVVRAVYATLLFILAILFARDVLFPPGDRFSVLGRGDELFLAVVLTQFAGIYLFLPAMTCAAITSEKERNTLGLLFLTRLSPVKIILEKFLSRVFPMLSLLLLSLPLFGIAYTLGGLESSLIWEGIVRLFATTLMVGAIGIAASSWCRTTAGAFFLTYAVLLALSLGPVFVLIALDINPGHPVMQILAAPLDQLNLLFIDDTEAVPFIFVGPTSMLWYYDSIGPSMGIGGGVGGLALLITLWQSTPLLFVSLCGLAAARSALIRRAEAKPKRYIIRLFRWIDASFRAANDRYARGIEIIKSRDTELGNDPVAWRETTKTPLGAFRYLVRILLVIEVPVMVVGLLSIGEDLRDDAFWLRIFTLFIWFGSCLLIAVKGATLFPMERSRESLGVLLTTALPTREILRQKLTGLWRLIGMCCVPMLTLFLIIAYIGNSVIQRPGAVVLVGFVGMVCVMATTFPMVGYMSVLVGLRTNRVSRAVLTSVSLFVGFCLAGPILYVVIEQIDFEDALATGSPFSIYSPLATLGEAILVPMDLSRSLIVIPLLAGTLLLHGGLALLLRNLCYRNAAHWLGRGDELTPPKVTEQQHELYRRHARAYEVAG